MNISKLEYPEIDYKEIAKLRITGPYWGLSVCFLWIWKRNPDEVESLLAEHLKFGRKSWPDGWQVPLSEIMSSLRSGKLVATGIPRGSDQRRIIEPDEWIDLSWQEIGCADLVTSKGKSAYAFRDVVCKAKDVRAKWPALDITKVTATIAAEKDIQRQLVARMLSRPNDPIEKAELRKEYPGIGVRAFDRAFAAAVRKADTPAWGKAGRRPKNRDT